MTNRSTVVRAQQARSRLESEPNVWLATASPAGVPHLVPLSLAWIDDRIVVATPTETPTVQNAMSSGRARAALDGADDVVIFDTDATVLGTTPADRPQSQRRTPRRKHAPVGAGRDQDARLRSGLELPESRASICALRVWLVGVVDECVLLARGLAGHAERGTDEVPGGAGVAELGDGSGDVFFGLASFEELADLVESDDLTLDRASPEVTTAYKELLAAVIA